LEGLEAGYSLPFEEKNYLKQREYMDPMLCGWNAACTGRGRAMPHIKVSCYISVLPLQEKQSLLTVANIVQSSRHSCVTVLKRRPRTDLPACYIGSCSQVQIFLKLHGVASRHREMR
jgi:hypothetical protein